MSVTRTGGPNTFVLIVALALLTSGCASVSDEEDWQRIQAIDYSQLYTNHLSYYPRCKHQSLIATLVAARCRGGDETDCHLYQELFPNTPPSQLPHGPSLAELQAKRAAEQQKAAAENADRERLRHARLKALWTGSITQVGLELPVGADPSRLSVILDDDFELKPEEYSQGLAYKLPLANMITKLCYEGGTRAVAATSCAAFQFAVGANRIPLTSMSISYPPDVASGQCDLAPNVTQFSVRAFGPGDRLWLLPGNYALACDFYFKTEADHSFGRAVSPSVNKIGTRFTAPQDGTSVTIRYDVHGDTISAVAGYSQLTYFK